MIRRWAATNLMPIIESCQLKNALIPIGHGTGNFVAPSSNGYINAVVQVIGGSGCVSGALLV